MRPSHRACMKDLRNVPDVYHTDPKYKHTKKTVVCSMFSICWLSWSLPTAVCSMAESVPTDRRVYVACLVKCYVWVIGVGWARFVNLDS